MDGVSCERHMEGNSSVKGAQAGTMHGVHGMREGHL